MNRFMLPLLAAVVMLASSCVSVKVPDGYARMSYTAQYDVKAVSTDGNIFTMREITNQDEKNGSLDYWATAMKNQFTLSRGYEFVQDGDFKSGKGPGRWQHYTHKFKGLEYVYIVGIVVDDDEIYVMEAGGEKDRFKNQEASVRKSFETLK